MATVESIRVDRCIYEKPAGSGSYWVVKRNKWIGPFKSIEAARAKRDEIEAEQSPKPIGGPFAEFYHEYYKPNYLDNMKTNTMIVWSGVFERTIIPFFKDKRIGEIIKLDCLNFRREQQAKYSIATVNSRWDMLHHLFKKALELKFISEDPCAGVKRLTGDKIFRPTLSETEIIELVNNIKHPYKYAVALGGLAGARVSEILGFKWIDFELDDKKRAKIKFTRQINQARNVDTLKSKASQATLPMVTPLTKFILEWKKECPDEEWLFQGEVRKYISKIGHEFDYKWHRKPHPHKYEFSNYRSLSTWWFRRIQGEYGVPENMRFHDLRHSFATNLCIRCTNVKLIQELCRHSDADITMNLYAQIRPEEIEKVWEWDF